jgi:hypothetical protein
VLCGVGWAIRNHTIFLIFSCYVSAFLPATAEGGSLRLLFTLIVRKNISLLKVNYLVKLFKNRIKPLTIFLLYIKL